MAVASWFTPCVLRPNRFCLLYITDLFYVAKGRPYRDEDLFVIEALQSEFDIAVCGPRQAVAILDMCASGSGRSGFDAVIVRNSGPVIHYAAEYAEFRRVAGERRIAVYNPLDGKADMIGKQYLVDLTAAGFPVVPTVDRVADLDRLPVVDSYVVKPKLGSDSIGMCVVGRDDIAAVHTGDALIQPRLDLLHEISFYAIDRDVQYALVAADAQRRWALVPHDPTEAELEFAGLFLDWNGLTHGIQRVDGCRTRDGALLLMELEDLNPYLSLDVLDDDERRRFVDRMAVSIRALIDARGRGSAPAHPAP